MRNPAGAAELPSGPKTSVTSKMIPEKGFCLTPKGATTGVQRAACGSGAAGCRPLA